ncbi:unnamed protein product [Linum trigynum]|uniref:Uncharacterized protein n=1 Tax=Linum trigynum TaxID=586398 RepID=A0AAV2CES7_9ROSI
MREKRSIKQRLSELHGQNGDMHGRAPWPCERAEVRLNDTLRFELHGQNGDMHGRAPWPCDSGFPGFKPNSEPRGRAGFLDPKHPRDEL